MDFPHLLATLHVQDKLCTRPVAFRVKIMRAPFDMVAVDPRPKVAMGGAQ